MEWTALTRCHCFCTNLVEVLGNSNTRIC
ncbi:hypothetical protein ID866_10038 [Astraeus odoratus]|nr:hypothetical protein ID866_10038 [Astraeus odoratus]